jgi:hypothetical protein
VRTKLIFLSCIFFWRANAQVSTFSFNINGSVPPGFTEALTIAGQKWSNYLQINVPIKVNVFTVNTTLVSASAITLANGRQNFTNAPFSNFLYPTALANQLAGVETNTGEFDMDIYFNLATPFYFGAGKPYPFQLDFISTAMHEIGHGLGFYSDGYVNNANEGSFGNIPSFAVFPLTTSFPWRGQDSVPSIFDKYIVRSSNNSLVGIAPENSIALGDSIKNGALYFSGPVYANASHFNTPVRLAGGAGTFSLGTDLLHIHNSYANTIMSYYWGGGDTVRTPGAWELGILKEIGWNLKAVGIQEQENILSVSAYPNPADKAVSIKATNIQSVKVYTILGSMVCENNTTLKADEANIDTRNLEDGIYFFTVSFSGNWQPITKTIFIQH